VVTLTVKIAVIEHIEISVERLYWNNFWCPEIHPWCLAVTAHNSLLIHNEFFSWHWRLWC